eukprot:2681602-Prymnesium_polylepis.1
MLGSQTQLRPTFPNRGIHSRTTSDIGPSDIPAKLLRNVRLGRSRMRQSVSRYSSNDVSILGAESPGSS